MNLEYAFGQAKQEVVVEIQAQPSEIGKARRSFSHSLSSNMLRVTVAFDLHQCFKEKGPVAPSRVIQESIIGIETSMRLKFA